MKKAVVVKKKNKWYKGFLEHDEKATSLAMNGQIKKLSDVKEVSQYKGLKTYLKTSNSIKEYDKIIERTGCQSIYVLDNPIDLTEKQMESYLWVEVNSVCKKCKKECKQSVYSTIFNCPKYEEI